MTFLETNRDFSSERLRNVFRKKGPLYSKTLPLLLIILSPVVVQIISVLAVLDDPQAIGPDGWVEPIVEVSAAFLPLMDKFLLGAPNLLPHAFSYVTGFFAGLIVLLVLMVIVPSAPMLAAMIKSSAQQADKKGKSFKVYRFVLLMLTLSLIVYVGQFLAMAGTRDVVLYYETVPRPDLLKVERIMRYLLDHPLLYCLCTGAAWGGAGVVWRLGLLAIGNVHRLVFIHSEWEKFFDAERRSALDGANINTSRGIES